MKRALVITASDRAAAGIYKDLSGGALKIGLENLGYQVVGLKLVQDDMHQISTTIRGAIEDEIDLIVTTGGTGVSPTDVTPEATKPLIERTIPGFMEALRSYSREKAPLADLTRGLAGVNGKSLIINLPGSPSAVRDGLVIIERLAGHIHDQLAGNDHSKSN